MIATIRARIIAAFAAFLACVCVLAAFHWGSLVSIRQKLFISEYFEDLFNDILEARRYEKNFLLYHDKESLNECVVYIGKAEGVTEYLGKDIARVAGQESFDQFRKDLAAYKSRMEAYASDGGGEIPEVQAEKVRAEGKAIGDFANSLLEMKRERIHKALTETLGLPVGFLLVFILLLMLVSRLLFKEMLWPLAVVHRTMGRVAEGDFSPVPYEGKGKDEITQLIHAFNKMAGELEAKQEQLVQSRKIAAIGTFTAGIAHELNNPINNIYITAEMLLEDYETMGPPECKEFVLDILNQAERAAEIIKNLLDFSRSELPSFTELNIMEVINKTLKLVKNQIMLGGIRVDVKCPEELPPVRGSLRNLEQAFLNLFINAIQAMPSGGVLSVDVSRAPGSNLRIEIRDTGTGIKPEQLEHIFEPFYTTKAVGRGTGLGLAVTYTLIKKHGGYIEVESEVGTGTAFTIHLPVKTDTEAAA